MGLDKRVILGSIRISLGSSTSDDEVDEAAARMLSICSDLERTILP
jgi:cysteine sulfinate desulfinase/cysteine desulfurase-like protein